MTKKHKVEDSVLEKVTGGAGIMDPVAQKKLDQIGSVTGGGNTELGTNEHDLDGDMILTEEVKED